MKNILICFTFILLLLTGSFIISPSLTYSQQSTGPDDGSRAGQESNRAINGFIPLVGIPYVNTKDSSLSLPGYVDALYKAAISIAAFMAVVKIIFAGVKYMLSDVVTSKEDAKKDIRGALIGLLIVIGAVLILNTINPELKELTSLGGPPGLNLVLEVYDNSDPVYTYREVCSSISNPSGLSCKELCDSKEGEYSSETTICSHDQVPLTTEDINETSLVAVGEDVLLTGGKAQIDQAIEDSGKILIFNERYPSDPSHSNRITRLINCEERGGTSYQVFSTDLTYNEGQEALVCYQ